MDVKHGRGSERGKSKVNPLIGSLIFDRDVMLDGPVTMSGKRVQMAIMLCLTVLPILVLWAYSVFTLTDTIHKKIENQRTKNNVQLSVELGKLVHHLQQERDMNILYLSALGPQTKIFLLTEYIQTDRAIYSLSKWPGDFDDRNREQFQSKEHLQKHLSLHRQIISKNNYDLNEEIVFYTSIIDAVIVWLYKSITEGKVAQIWKTLVAYLKLTSGKQNLGIERALGTLFFIDGRFQSQKTFEMYNNRINRFRAFHTTAELYSSRVNSLYTSEVNKFGVNVTEIINYYRHEIQHYTETKMIADIQTARFWFDNMTLYLDTLLNVQRDLGYEIIQSLDVVIEQSTQDITIGAIFLVIVLLMCPLVIFATENLTSVIQKNSHYLAVRTADLAHAHTKINRVLSEMMPSIIAEKIKSNQKVDVEYFRSVSILMVGIYGFKEGPSTPKEIVEIIECLYQTADYLVKEFRVNKLDGVDGSFVVFSGFPQRNSMEHLTLIADFALELVADVKSRTKLKNNLTIKCGMDTVELVSGQLSADLHL
ncbi:uncharacterized protein LOC117344743 [Pecten maximus]|uniref:uncharacterized protein LOC117344743 n=1 Tax=Pecten maximus TaxID=6579 RepID=UPI00145903D6|nr:uncharacterized protein LOC117344743 [Pecten maximus]